MTARDSTFNGMPGAAINITLNGIANNAQGFKGGDTSFLSSLRRAWARTVNGRGFRGTVLPGPFTLPQSHIRYWMGSSHNLLVELVAGGGFEPPTFGL